jgi:NOL1/NOP2/sun family putative RNA methylase
LACQGLAGEKFLKTVLFPETHDGEMLAAEFGYDPWLVERFLHYVPRPVDFLKKMDSAHSRYLRVNTLKTSSEALERRLTDKGFKLGRTALADVFSVQAGSISPGATTEYMLGLYYLQDLSSCIAVEALDVSKESCKAALDIAAAPGGKTSYIAQKMNNSGYIIALEPNSRRARSMAFNLARLGVANTCVTLLDGLAAGKLGRVFDRVLLDAPCSCEGVIAKDPSRKTSHTPGDVDYCSALQQKLIESAVSAVKPGGLLVYSTCSFAPEENEAVVQHAIDSCDFLKVEPFELGSEGLLEFGGHKFSKSLQGTRRFYPHIDDTTGFFIARLRHTGS